MKGLFKCWPLKFRNFSTESREDIAYSIPMEVIFDVFKFLDRESLEKTVQPTCKRWNKVVKGKSNSFGLRQLYLIKTFNGRILIFKDKTNRAPVEVTYQNSHILTSLCFKKFELNRYLSSVDNRHDILAIFQIFRNSPIHIQKFMYAGKSDVECRDFLKIYQELFACLVIQEANIDFGSENVFLELMEELSWMESSTLPDKIKIRSLNEIELAKMEDEYAEVKSSVVLGFMERSVLRHRIWIDFGYAVENFCEMYFEAFMDDPRQLYSNLTITFEHQNHDHITSFMNKLDGIKIKIRPPKIVFRYKLLDNDTFKNWVFKATCWDSSVHFQVYEEKS